MDEKKVFDLLEKIYVELQSTKSELKGEINGLNKEVTGLKSDVKDLKSDVIKLGTKIDGEITNKLKILSEEQSIMRKDIHEIKEHQSLHDTKIDDLRFAVDSLSHKQSDQEKEIWELRKVK